MPKRILPFILSLSSLLFAAGGGVGDYDYSDNIPASKTHPGSDTIPLERVPMFICFGWDDNGIADKSEGGGTTWLINYLKDKKNPAGSGNSRTFDGALMRHSFYMTAKYGRQWVYENYPGVRESWKTLYDDGHEIGNHSTIHLMFWSEETGSVTYDGRAYTKEEWLTKEIDTCHTLLTTEYSKSSKSGGIGIPANELKGWRTPRLEWNNSLLEALKEKGYVYDCSIESNPSGDGTDFYWPHTLDNGTPLSDFYPALDQVTSHPGLWEMPAYRFIIPEELQAKTRTDNMSGLDYNVWVKKDWGGMELSSPDFTNILVHTLDKRMEGNRAPLLIGVHSDIYTSQKDSEYPGSGTARERQLSVENFIDSALAKYPNEVRFVTAYDIIEWMREPIGLGNGSSIDPAGNLINQEIKIAGVNRSEITITVPRSGNYSISLFSVGGKKLLETKLNSIARGQSKKAWNTNNIAPGSYLISISGEGYQRSQKITLR